MPPLIPEFDETFEYDGGQVQGIWTDFDQNQDAGEPGMITRVSRLLVSDDDADLLITARFLTRTKNGDRFETKNPRRSGVGVTELDLHRIDGTRFERNF